MLTASNAASDDASVVDAKSCERWLGLAPLADAEQACERLRTLIETRAQRRLSERALVEVLERLREPIRAASDEHAKRFIGRALPLRPPEVAALERVVALFNAQWSAYRTLLDRALAAPARGNERLVHVYAARCLEASGDTALAYYRARYELPGTLWQQLYCVYRAAEAADLHTMPLPARGDRAGSTCRELLLRVLLVHCARPFGLTIRELDTTRRLARNWADQVELTARPETRSTAGVHLVIDLTGERPPQHDQAKRTGGSADDRILSLDTLKRTVAKRLAALKGGASAQEIGLGREYSAPEASQLLRHLFNAWFAPPQVRQFKRRVVDDTIDVIVGFAAIHAAFSRDDPAQPQSFDHSDGAEPWRLLEDSPAGFRIQRPQSGARLNHLELVAVRPVGARRYILTETRWLAIGQDQAAVGGLQSLPGLARAIEARVVALGGAHPESEPFRPAFLVETGSGPADTIIVPRGTFLEGCFTELHDGASIKRVRIGAALRRGNEFECVGISWLF